MLAPDGVPEAVLRTTAARRWITQGADDLSDTGRGPAQPGERAVLLSLRALHRLSLVTHDPSRTPASVEVHALVQRAARESVPEKVLPRLAVAAADAVEELWSATAECAYELVLAPYPPKNGVAIQPLWRTRSPRRGGVRHLDNL